MCASTGMSFAAGDPAGTAPAHAAVGGREPPDLEAVAGKGHDNRAVGLDERLAAEPAGVAGGGDGGGPHQAAVVGRAHDDRSAGRGDVRFEGAGAVERAGGMAVADHPVLLVALDALA